jgi:hypothetical protein
MGFCPFASGEMAEPLLAALEHGIEGDSPFCARETLTDYFITS